MNECARPGERGECAQPGEQRIVCGRLVVYWSPAKSVKDVPFDPRSSRDFV